MTPKQKRIWNHLHTADEELRKAMVEAGGYVLKGKTHFSRVTDAIRESEWYLDEALTLTMTANLKIEIKKGLTIAKKPL